MSSDKESYGILRNKVTRRVAHNLKNSIRSMEMDKWLSKEERRRRKAKFKLKEIRRALFSL